MALNTNTYGYVIDPLFSFCDNGGKTIANGYVRVFRAGTSTPVLTYRNFDGAFNAETIELDNSGRTMTQVIASKGSLYKVCVYDAEHSQEDPILTVDKVAVIGSSVNATNIVQGLNDVAGSGWVKSVAADDTAEVSLDPTGVSDHVETFAQFEAHDQYKVPLVKDDGSQADAKLGHLMLNTLQAMSILDSVGSASGTDYVVLLVGGNPKIISVEDLAHAIATRNSLIVFEGSISPLSPPDGDEVWQALDDGFEVVLHLTNVGDTSYSMFHVFHEEVVNGRVMKFGLVSSSNVLTIVTYSIDDSAPTPEWTVTVQNRSLAYIESLAPEWTSDDYAKYKKGYLVSHRGNIYRSVTNTPSSTWVASEWEQTTIADELARKGDSDMNTIELFATSACRYEFTGNVRAATFSKVSEVLDFKTLSTGVAANVSVGFKPGEKINIVSAKVKAGQAACLQSPAIASGVTGLCASLQFELVALDNTGDMVGSTYIIAYLKELDWNVFENKGIELTTPSTLPAGATCFGFRYGGTFSCDDYNIETAYVGQTVTPELVLEIATESETVVDVATGTEIEY